METFQEKEIILLHTEFFYILELCRLRPRMNGMLDAKTIYDCGASEQVIREEAGVWWYPFYPK